MDAETGELLWRFDSDDGEFYRRPVISGGVVYLMEQYTDGLFALDSETGELLWNNPFVGNQQKWDSRRPERLGQIEV